MSGESDMEDSSHDPWQVSWRAINARAWWYLNHSSEILPSVSRGRPFHGIPRMRLSDDAMSFGSDTEPTTLTVFEIRQDDVYEPFVREAVWKRTADLRDIHQKFHRLHEAVLIEPTIAVRDAPVLARQLYDLLREAKDFSVPVVWLDEMQSVVTDVGAVSFEFFSQDQPPAVLRLQWSYEKPASWEPIATWFIRLWKLLEDCFVVES
jgi:hypothetical protein